MKETMDSLTSIPQQLRKHISPKPKPTIPELKMMGKWLDAPQLVQLVVKLKVRSLGGGRRGVCMPCHAMPCMCNAQGPVLAMST